MFADAVHLAAVYGFVLPKVGAATSPVCIGRGRIDDGRSTGNGLPARRYFTAIRGFVLPEAGAAIG